MGFQPVAFVFCRWSLLQRRNDGLEALEAHPTEEGNGRGNGRTVKLN